MPKKHQRFHAKPESPAHHSLAPSVSRQHGGSGVRGTGSASTTASVNDLISHLRRTQIPSPSSDDPPRSQSAQRSFVIPRSVHPSLRGLLELPETRPPRPRPGVRRTVFGVRPSRPTVGPPPPASWLTRSNDAASEQDLCGRTPGTSEESIHRLNRLQRPMFPGRKSLVHILLKSMALNWCWHVEYDGPFLSQLPNHIKELLMSYIAVYSRNSSLAGHMKGLKPIFLTQRDEDQLARDNPDFDESRGVNGDFRIRQLDLGNALGNWIGLRQLSHELTLHTSPAVGVSSHEIQEDVPASWDEEVRDMDEEGMPGDISSPSIPRAVTQTLRFPELRALSLAHPKPSAASWSALLNLLVHLPTLTHLSLAHWPMPTRNPSAVRTRIRDPVKPLLTSDAFDNNWAEAASTLRQLSRSTYCLKWLDLEGCGDWLPALKWVGKDPDGTPYRPETVGPEWNGSWRDVEWLGIGPGFFDLTEPNDPFHVSEPETGSSLHARHLQIARDVSRHIRQIRSGKKWLEFDFGLGLEQVEPEIVVPPGGPAFSVYP
ncbi:uncharacterized protein N7515_005938 [Penicillium bovifimosum]|uniref:Tafazzin n=1 Tax=Penicillium bovifimosum TaxID=126998 RepID=A0A9W9GTP9_9EURO|nr:uncharacterized protein N7515_005938 [Penicillium bovifimosum]KAJ5129899.1 hypothetical protein N7515_005938 [Penicillium bovifimosum]